MADESKIYIGRVERNTKKQRRYIEYRPRCEERNVDTSVRAVIFLVCPCKKRGLLEANAWTWKQCCVRVTRPIFAAGQMSQEKQLTRQMGIKGGSRTRRATDRYNVTV